MQKRDVASIFKFVNDGKYSNYIKKRQICKIAQEKMKNPSKPWDRLVEEYSIADYSTFNRRFKFFMGVTPEDFLQKCEKDIWNMTPEYIYEKSVVEKDNSNIEGEATEVMLPSFNSIDVENYFSEEDDAQKMLELYDSFQEIEELRAIYGLTVLEAIYIFMTNNGDIETIYDECERYDDEQLYSILYDYDYDSEIDYYEDDMTLAEAWEYYQGEDEMKYE